MFCFRVLRSLAHKNAEVGVEKAVEDSKDADEEKDGGTFVFAKKACMYICVNVCLNVCLNVCMCV